MTTTSTDIETIGRISSAEEAERLGLAVYAALLADLRSLAPADWGATTVCAPWTVTDMVRHLLGAAKGNASTREMMRQQIYGARHKSDASTAMRSTPPTTCRSPIIGISGPRSCSPASKASTPSRCRPG